MVSHYPRIRVLPIFTVNLCAWGESTSIACHIPYTEVDRWEFPAKIQSFDDHHFFPLKMMSGRPAASASP